MHSLLFKQGVFNFIGGIKMTKKEIRTCPTMSMRLFLEAYYDINEEISMLLSLHSHKSLKQAASLYDIHFSKICFDDLTREMVWTGKVILVQDHYGNVAPYINPLVSLVDEYETDMDERYTSYEIFDEGDDIYDKYQGRQKIK